MRRYGAAATEAAVVGVALRDRGDDRGGDEPVAGRRQRRSKSRDRLPLVAALQAGRLGGAA